MSRSAGSGRRNATPTWTRSRRSTLTAECLPSAPSAAVMVDGGRVQTRQPSDQPGPGVCEPGWHEVKVACCQAPIVPGPRGRSIRPRKFLNPVEVTLRLAAEVNPRRCGHPTPDEATPVPARPKKKKKKRPGPTRRVRTVVARAWPQVVFGWQMARCNTSGSRSGRRKGYVCDGQKYNWSLFEFHLLPLGFVGILDVLHLLAYLYGAAQAVEEKGPPGRGRCTSGGCGGRGRGRWQVVVGTACRVRKTRPTAERRFGYGPASGGGRRTRVRGEQSEPNEIPRVPSARSADQQLAARWKA